MIRDFLLQTEALSGCLELQAVWHGIRVCHLKWAVLALQ